MTSARLNSAEPITSRRNPLVKRLRLLHHARGRIQEGLLLLEGTHLLEEVLRLGLQPLELLATPPLWARQGFGQAALQGPQGRRCQQLERLQPQPQHLLE